MSERKKKPAKKGPNDDIVQFLLELSDYERNVSRNVHKANAYRRAASVISHLDQRLQSGEEAKKLDGIGHKIACKIDEFLSTGTVSKVEQIRKDDSTAVLNLLTRVVGIGPAKAKELFDLGIRTLDDLGQNQDHLTPAQKIGLKYFTDFETRIPRQEVKSLERVLMKEVSRLDPLFEVTICGSYRRGLASSGDIDVLLTHQDHDQDHELLKRVVDALQESGLITDTLSLGPSKFMGVCKLHKSGHFRRMDIRLLPKHQYFCGVLYFTGSDQFNQRMRSHALEHRFTLNEYSLRPLDKNNELGPGLPVSSEEDIFDYICLDFVPPDHRDW